MLQWGRAHVSAEIVSNEAAANREVFASMGPRSRERGDPEITNSGHSHNRASMGPRSRERGDILNFNFPERGRGRFNGAALT